MRQLFKTEHRCFAVGKTRSDGSVHGDGHFYCNNNVKESIKNIVHFMSYNGAKWGYLSNIVEAVRGRRAKFIKLLSLICIKKSMISD